MAGNARRQRQNAAFPWPSEALARAQTGALDLHYLFAPLKHARLDYMVQKAVELGASRLQPVLTRHGQVGRVNLDRMRANAIEAAEQCGILTLAEIGDPVALDRLLAERDPARLLVFCDEDAEVKDPVAALTAARPRRLGVAPARRAGRPRGGLCRRRTRSAACACRMWFASRSARASCAPIPPPSPR